MCLLLVDPQGSTHQEGTMDDLYSPLWLVVPSGGYNGYCILTLRLVVPSWSSHSVSNDETKCVILACFHYVFVPVP